MITDQQINEALNQLPAYKTAAFREGQLEAIRSVVNNNRTLVVQKTGWGKSLVYFLSTRLLKKQGKGITVVVSPLLALMNNQVEAAARFGLKACAITSNIKAEEELEEIDRLLREDKIDVLFVSPERFGIERFKNITFPIFREKIGLMVIDEAHCISDWGHDFRLDYMKLAEVVNTLPAKTAVLGTTATANERVIKDIETQFGKDVHTIRGPLTRDSLYIQVINLHTTEAKLAWLADNIDKLPKPGVIYCTTHGDCQLVEAWLKGRGVKASAYFSDENLFPPEKRKEIEDCFAKTHAGSAETDRIDVLVATCAFGMGYDKPDIGFVIHFQKPGNIISYYQEIGRAARDISKAYCIMLVGDEDDSVQQYFMKAAFPSKYLIMDVVELLEAASGGLKLKDIVNSMNKKKSEIEKTLKFLLFYKDVYKEGSLYYLNPDHPKLCIDFDHMEEVTERRRNELHLIGEYITSKACYMQTAIRQLDDHGAKPCGHCANCDAANKLPETVSPVNLLKAIDFLKKNHSVMPIRKQWPVAVNGKLNIPAEERLRDGIILSNYGDCGWGKLVKEGKYPPKGVNPGFDDQLVKAAYNTLKAKVKEWGIEYVSPMPSCSKDHGYLVPDFAKRLAERLELPYVELLYKEEGAAEQKDQNNSKTQYDNANNALQMKAAFVGKVKGNILLVDDMMDSGWSFTVAASKLVRNGAAGVYGFALANTASRS